MKIQIINNVIIEGTVFAPGVELDIDQEKADNLIRIGVAQKIKKMLPKTEPDETPVAEKAEEVQVDQDNADSSIGNILDEPVGGGFEASTKAQSTKKPAGRKKQGNRQP